MAFVSTFPFKFISQQRMFEQANCKHNYFTKSRPLQYRTSLFMSGVSQSNTSNEASSGKKAPDAMVNAAHAAADAAGAVIRGFFRGGELAAGLKDDTSPVTAADIAAEAAMRAILEKEFPNHAVMGEESGGAGVETIATAEWSWCLDPIGIVVS